MLDIVTPGYCFQLEINYNIRRHDCVLSGSLTSSWVPEVQGYILSKSQPRAPVLNS